MSAPVQLTLTPPDALQKLGAGLSAYAAVAGKDATAVLVQKGAQVVFGNKQSRYGASFPGLITLFLRQSPARGAIYDAAVGRDFRLGATGRGGALSATALARASRMMGGFKSILASETKGAEDAVPTLSFVRFNARGRRVRYNASRKSFAASGQYIGPTPGGAKRLNFRAVATYFELRLRETGRRFLGSSFLFQRWQRLAQSDPRREAGTWRVLVNQNPRSSLSLLGEAALSGDPAAGNVELRISSYVPGVREIGTTRGLFSQVIAAINADIGVYLARKQREGALEALRGLRPAA